MICFRLKIWSTLIEGEDTRCLMVAAAAAGARAANEQPRAAAIDRFPTRLATKRRAREPEGRFKYAFSPGLYYQLGLKGGGGMLKHSKLLWSRPVTRTGTKGPYPTVSLDATGH